MIAQIKMRRGTTAEWAAASPVVLAAGEPGWDSTLKGMKVGDGSTEWAALPWIDSKNRPDINADTLDGVHLSGIRLGQNLLHNWDFTNPVNQRGCPIGAYLPAGYGFDRWDATASSFQYLSGGLSVPVAGDCHLVQRIEGSFAGKTLTASVAVGFGITTWFESVTLTALSGGSDTKYFPGIGGVRALIIDMGAYLEYHFIVENGGMPLSALKLELGTVSTLHLDPPMNHAVEMPKCKRFYRLWSTDAARTAALLEVGLMRTAAPTTGTIVIGSVTYYYASSDL